MAVMLIAACGNVAAQKAQVIENNYHGAVYSFSFDAPTIKIQQADGSTYMTASWPLSTPTAQMGAPDLPILTEFIEVPLCDNVKVSVSDVRSRSLTPLKYPMMPSQPAPSKSDIAPLPFVKDSAIYATDAYYAHPSAWVEMMGVARDRNVAMLRLSPLSYNPVTGEVELIESMKVTLQYEGADQAATEKMHSTYHSPAFGLGCNYLSTLPGSKEYRTSEPMHYLIVAHSSFRGQLDDFIAWKKRQGYIVTVGYTDDSQVGTTSNSIAAYTKSFYTNASAELPAPTFLVLVGDHQQIPAFNARCTQPDNDHITDLYFATWTDGDNLPDCYLGRFSARNASELEPQLSKSILYESYGFEDPSYLSRGVLIAGVDGGYSSDNAYKYADPNMDYAAKTYVNSDCGFNTVVYYKNNTGFAPTGVTVTGSSQNSATAAALRNLYNNGYGFINYSAHGDDDCWADPSFTATNASQMTNAGMPSVMIGNCCLSGRFNTNQNACLGEALLRRGDNAGAAVYIGGTNSTYWPQDFYWSVGIRTNITNQMNTSYDSQHTGMYDHLFHTHGESSDERYTFAASMVTAGNTAVETYGQYSLYYWEIYEMFGDPSLMPWLGEAADMNVNYDPVIVIGSSIYNLQVAPFSYVALTDVNNDIVCAAWSDATGAATLQLPSGMIAGTYELVAWAHNYKPFFAEVSVQSTDGPYLIASSMYTFPDNLTAGELHNIYLTVSNFGNQASPAATLNITSDGDGVQIMPVITSLSPIAAADNLHTEAAAGIFVPEDTPDGTNLTIDIQITYDTTVSSRTFHKRVSAPKLTLVSASANGFLRSGENATINCTIANQGSAPTADLTFSLSEQFGFTTTQASPVNAGVIQPGSEVVLSFNVTMDDSLPQSKIPFELTANGKLVQLVELACDGSYTIEDFESGTLTQLNWQMNNKPWIITNENPHSGTYCARSASGLSGNRNSQMSLTFTLDNPDSVSFWYKVSSEDGYDILYVTVDNVEVFNASGEDGWSRAAFAIGAGSHTIAFRYEKDWWTSSGSDCAWVDDIVIPISSSSITFVHDTVCQGQEYTYAGNVVPTDEVGSFVYSDSNSYLALDVVDTPNVTISQSGHYYYFGYAVLVAHGADSYVWNTGETGSTIFATPDNGMAYTVTGYLDGGCSGEASFDMNNGIDEVGSSMVRLYPNPASSAVTIVAHEASWVSITNMTGQTMMQLPANGYRTTVDISALPRGIYFARIATGNDFTVVKFVKE